MVLVSKLNFKAAYSSRPFHFNPRLVFLHTLHWRFSIYIYIYYNAARTDAAGQVALVQFVDQFMGRVCGAILQDTHKASYC